MKINFLQCKQDKPVSILKVTATCPSPQIQFQGQESCWCLVYLNTEGLRTTSSGLMRTKPNTLTIRANVGESRLKGASSFVEGRYTELMLLSIRLTRFWLSQSKLDPLGRNIRIYVWFFSQAPFW